MTEKVRPVVRIPAVTTGSPDMRVYVAQRGPRMRFGVLLAYTQQPQKTPTGGRYVSRRVTVRSADGTRFVGQYKNGADTVILRPESEAKK